MTTASDLSVLGSPVILDPTDRAVLADPDGFFRALRRAGRPTRTTDGAWVICSHAGVGAALRDHRTFSCADTNASVRRQIPVLVGTDPPEHTRLRQAAMQGFSSSARKRWLPAVADCVAGVVERALKARSFDAVARICSAVPTAVLAELMAVPQASLARLMTQPPTIANGDRRRLLTDFFGTQVEARRRRPGEDLISSLVSGSLSTDEIVGHCGLLLSAGVDAPRDLLANLLVHIEAHPAHLDRAGADTAFASALVEEAMRYFSPVQAVYRSVLHHTTIDEATPRAGDRVLLVIASANRDERVWTDADLVIPERYLAPQRASGHLGLGVGAHACLGAALARVSTLATLQAIARSGKRLRVVGPVVRGRTLHFRRVVRLDVVVEA